VVSTQSTTRYHAQFFFFFFFLTSNDWDLSYHEASDLKRLHQPGIGIEELSTVRGCGSSRQEIPTPTSSFNESQASPRHWSQSSITKQKFCIIKTNCYFQCISKPNKQFDESRPITPAPRTTLHRRPIKETSDKPCHHINAAKRRNAFRYRQ
jgi:hypothetical protein